MQIRSSREPLCTHCGGTTVTFHMRVVLCMHCAAHQRTRTEIRLQHEQENRMAETAGRIAEKLWIQKDTKQGYSGDVQ